MAGSGRAQKGHQNLVTLGLLIWLTIATLFGSQLYSDYTASCSDDSSDILAPQGDGHWQWFPPGMMCPQDSESGYPASVSSAQQGWTAAGLTTTLAVLLVCAWVARPRLTAADKIIQPGPAHRLNADRGRLGQHVRPA